MRQKYLYKNTEKYCLAFVATDGEIEELKNHFNESYDSLLIYKEINVNDARDILKECIEEEPIKIDVPFIEKLPWEEVDYKDVNLEKLSWHEVRAFAKVLEKELKVEVIEKGFKRNQIENRIDEVLNGDRT